MVVAPPGLEPGYRTDLVPTVYKAAALPIELRGHRVNRWLRIRSGGAQTGFAQRRGNMALFPIPVPLLGRPFDLEFDTEISGCLPIVPTAHNFSIASRYPGTNVLKIFNGVFARKVADCSSVDHNPDCVGVFRIVWFWH